MAFAVMHPSVFVDRPWPQFHKCQQNRGTPVTSPMFWNYGHEGLVHLMEEILKDGTTSDCNKKTGGEPGSEQPTSCCGSDTTNSQRPCMEPCSEGTDCCTNGSEKTDLRCKQETQMKRNCNPFVKWTKAVDLPEGFNVSHIADIKVSDGKVILSLQQSYRHPWGFSKASTFLPVSVPQDVIQRTLAVHQLSKNKVKVVGLIKSTDKSSDAYGEVKMSSRSEDHQIDVEGPSTNTRKSTDMSPNTEGSMSGCCAEDKMEKHDYGCWVNRLESNITSSSTDDKQMCCDEAQHSDETDDKTETQEQLTLNASTTEAEGDFEVIGTVDREESMINDPLTQNSEAQLKNESQAPQPQSSDNGASEPDSEVDQFQAKFVLRDFKPEEISIKLSDHQLHIDAVLHRGDEGTVRHHEFHQTVVLPTDVDEDALRSRLNEDGELIISAPYLPRIPHEKILTIEYQK